ncbi:efflux RND transporter periplasmic adaptor subunit [Larsenimonas suaedae]|uniref:Efflux RND transporter periplasmic adaptor subunit n=1 Tax=Larsenimonas suaedae TaxID=1851019 RepID=A0ABU1GUG1_9GAMM|nr:efflux RND transporter periplasmic adaptor subunit [Larsenimonas suaedae]MCM2970952.1 efflux RND transporter periplasmic adaptor subunit [Larsenimonas suaedae]MDR5895661.1 efflux RND transporter periplasmic adaptor subunit [Larsenimonas suaedae]
MSNPSSPSRRRSPAFWFTLVAVALLLIALGIWLWPGDADSDSDQPPTRPATSVAAQDAIQGTFPVTVDALGTVTSLNTVEVRPRVEGELLSIEAQEGQKVAKGDVIARIDPRSYQAQLEEAKGQLAQDQSQLDTARKDLARFQKLAGGSYVSQQDLDTQRQTVKRYEGAVRADRASIENAEVQLGYTTITAPVSGRLGIRNVDPGNIVQLGDENPIATITQSAPISVVFALPSKYRTQLTEAFDQARPLMATLSEDGEVIAKGQVTSLDSAIDTDTGTLRLRALFQNEDGALFPNQFVDVTLTLERLDNAVIVPATAIQTKDGQNFVYRVKEDATVERRPVTLSASNDHQAAIASGIKAGDTVVVDGVDRLSDGAAVKVVSQALPGDDSDDGNAHGTILSDSQ